MHSHFLPLVLVLLLPAVCLGRGSGATTRYWDCCKPSCAWRGKGPFTNGGRPVATCGRNGHDWIDNNEQSSCNGANGYTCNQYSPIVVNDNLSYGYGEF